MVNPPMQPSLSLFNPQMMRKKSIDSDYLNFAVQRSLFSAPVACQLIDTEFDDQLSDRELSKIPDGPLTEELQPQTRLAGAPSVHEIDTLDDPFSNVRQSKIPDGSLTKELQIQTRLAGALGNPNGPLSNGGTSKLLDGSLTEVIPNTFIINIPPQRADWRQLVELQIQTRLAGAPTLHEIGIPDDPLDLLSDGGPSKIPDGSLAKESQIQTMLAGALNIPNDPLSNGGTSKLPDGSLFEGDNRKQYFEFGVPLYEASIKCDWKAAERILDKKKELVRFSITNNGETALHVAASVKRSKHVETFVKNLMKRMDDKDLELVNKNSDTALYLAVAAGNIKTVRMMVERNKNLPLIAGAGGILMPLYTAAFYGHHEVVKYLYEKSRDLSDNGWNSQNRGWLLRKCVEGDMFDVALKIVTKYPELGSGSVLENLARKPEAFSKSRPNIIKRSIHSVLALIGLVGAYNKESEALQLLKLIWKDIPQKTKKEIEEKLISWNDLDELKHIKFLLLQKFVSEQLHKLDKETQNIMMGSPNEIVQISESNSEMLFQATQLNELISRHLEKMRVETQKIYERSYGQHDEKAQDLQNLCSELMKKMDDKSNIIMRDSVYKTKGLQYLISKYITAMRSEITFKESQCSQVQFIAAEMGNPIFLVELIRQYPDLISILNDKSQSIFHIAVKHRHEGIYNLLYEIGSVKDMVTNLRDADENNILHLAAKRAERERLADVSGAALQMQRELLWFKEVRDRIPPVYREKKNKEGLTPRQLFTKEHRDLITDGEKWMKETASQCMVVAALIATIVFASAFTIPGGYNQNNGIPIFYRKPTFIVFVVADALSLFLSSTSILTFLSILTSRYAEHDFVSSLPNKLMLGVTTLFLSITAMMVTFSVSFFILYHNEMKWIPVSISALAVTPVLLYVALQHHVLVDVTRSTFGSWYLFKPKKQFLYYVNPRD